mgnify:CR=1 FL=1
MYPDHSAGKRFGYLDKKVGRGSGSGTTFCVKCLHKTFYLSAENNADMRIWVAAVMTGAEGNNSYS